MKEVSKEVIEALAQLLKERKETVAVAESVTAGLLQFALSGMPEATLVFQGGITAYNIEQKTKHLKVDPVHALRVNCVSEKVAVEMATEVSSLFDADWGLGVTGYAAPVPESYNQLFAYYAVVYRQQLIASGRMNGMEDTPASVQGYYANTLVEKLLALLKE